MHLVWDIQSLNHAPRGDPITLHNSAWQRFKGTALRVASLIPSAGGWDLKGTYH